MLCMVGKESPQHALLTGNVKPVMQFLKAPSVVDEV